jgi:hypothetical protein
MKSTYSFSRRAPDLLAYEIASVLSGKSWFEFKALFEVVHGNLRARNGATGGEEMLRLRAYEKLQNLVSAGAVEKSSKQYRGNAAGLARFFAGAAAVNASFAARPSAPSADATALPA